jgi:serine protease AprX
MSGISAGQVRASRTHRTRPNRTWWLPAILCLVLALLTLNVPGSGAAGVSIDPLLSQVLSTAGPTERVEAVVSFANRPSASDLAALSRTGVRVVRLAILPMAGIRGTRSQVSAVASLPLSNLVSVHYNRRLQYFLDESVPLIDADQVWASEGIVGRGVTTAVIDSGVDALHPDLPWRTKVIQNVKVATDPFGPVPPLVVENLATTDTTSGHGTHVASIVSGSGAAAGGRYTGVAPGANLIGVGVGELITILHALTGFDWVLQNRQRYGIDIVSNSWGTTGSFAVDDPINLATKAVHDAGMVVVFAAGNEGPGNNTLNPYSVAPWVVGVAAGTKNGGLADFSSRGIPGDSLHHPTLTAPGTEIVAARAVTGPITLPGLPADLALGADALRYTTLSGTSMAAPHISGVVALMLEGNPGLTPDQVKELLRSTATPMPGFGEHEVGAGYVNALAAVTAALSGP